MPNPMPNRPPMASLMPSTAPSKKELGSSRCMTSSKGDAFIVHLAEYNRLTFESVVSRTKSSLMLFDPSSQRQKRDFGHLETGRR